MPTPVECVCCKDIDATASKSEISVSGEAVDCITDHEGFHAVWLPESLGFTASFFSYRYHYGTHDFRDVPTHEYVVVHTPIA